MLGDSIAALRGAKSGLRHTTGRRRLSQNNASCCVWFWFWQAVPRSWCSVGHPLYTKAYGALLARDALGLLDGHRMLHVLRAQLGCS